MPFPSVGSVRDEDGDWLPVEDGDWLPVGDVPCGAPGGVPCVPGAGAVAFGPADVFTGVGGATVPDSASGSGRTSFSRWCVPPSVPC